MCNCKINSIWNQLYDYWSIIGKGGEFAWFENYRQKCKRNEQFMFIVQSKQLRHTHTKYICNTAIRNITKSFTVKERKRFVAVNQLELAHCILIHSARRK